MICTSCWWTGSRSPRQGATFKIYHNPLVNWLWIGGIVLLFGTLVAAWPDREPEGERKRAAARKQTVPSEA